MRQGEIEVLLVNPHVLMSAAPPDLPEVAGFYSQLAGVLAGFSFAALVALVASKRESAAGAKFRWYSVAPLTSAFVALVASSLDYALVAGETAGTNFASLVATTGLISLTTADATVPDPIPFLALMVVAAFAVLVAYSASRYETSPEWDEVPVPEEE